MSKFDETFTVGQPVQLKKDASTGVFAHIINGASGVVRERREHPCDPFWWGYTVELAGGGEVRALGYQLEKGR